MARIQPYGPDGAPRGEAVEARDGLVLGRASSCGVVLSDDQASRQHARIEVCFDGFVLVDLGSANGTFVEEQRIDRRVLRPGERIRIGDTWLRFEDDTPSRSGPAAAVPGVPPLRASPPRAGSASWLPFVGLGCLILAAVLTLLVAAGVAVWWIGSGARSDDASGRPAEGQAPAERSTTPAPGVEPGGVPGTVPAVLSVPPDQADILRFTLRIATNAVLDGCAAMPDAWVPPDLTLEVAARVDADGVFALETADGATRLALGGRWRDEALEAEGRWTTDTAAGQRDEGRFRLTGRRVLGTWFGDRIEATVSSQLGAARCEERIDNSLSTATDLAW